MIASIMYHNVNSNKYTNDKNTIDQHLNYIKKRKIKTVFPGEETKENSLCLVFDDAYYNFYHYVYPLLKKNSQKASIAVPTSFIVAKTTMSPSSRLSQKHEDSMNSINYEKHNPFCTWTEINEMICSGLVAVLSHGHKHKIFDDKNDFEYDLQISKSIIEKETNNTCSSFVFPYGHADQELIKLAKSEYDYLFGIGGEKYPNWKSNNIIKRYPGDNLTRPYSIIDSIFPKRTFRYHLGALKNKLLRK